MGSILISSIYPPSFAPLPTFSLGAGAGIAGMGGSLLGSWRMQTAGGQVMEGMAMGKLKRFFRPSFFGVHLKNHDFFTAVHQGHQTFPIHLTTRLVSDIITHLPYPAINTLTGGQFATANQPRLMK